MPFTWRGILCCPRPSCDMNLMSRLVRGFTAARCSFGIPRLLFAWPGDISGHESCSASCLIRPGPASSSLEPLFECKESCSRVIFAGCRCLTTGVSSLMKFSRFFSSPSWWPLQAVGGQLCSLSGLWIVACVLSWRCTSLVCFRVHVFLQCEPGGEES